MAHKCTCNFSFQIEAAEVGNIKRIHIRHDNSGMGAGWFLQTVSIKSNYMNLRKTHARHCLVTGMYL